MEKKTVCVYCASSALVDAHYVARAKEFGTLLGERGYALVYGGAQAGLMGAVAKAAKEAGADVTGVIPRFFNAKEIVFKDAHEIIYTETLRERKAIMEAKANAFVALPGGFGTLEEIAEILTLRLLRRHAKPVAFFNVNGFYDELLALFERFYRERFAHEDGVRPYFVSESACAILDYIETARAESMAGKRH